MISLRSFVYHPGPLTVGSEAPSLSLTSDDGTWVQIRDYLDRHHVVLVFFRGEKSLPLVQAFDGAIDRIRELDSCVFAVHPSRPDRLRVVREQASLSIPLLYDLLALSARGFNQAGRLPRIRDGVVVVDKRGRIAFHEQGMVAVEHVLEVLSALEAPDEEAGPAHLAMAIDWKRADELMKEERVVVLDVRTKPEFDAVHVPGSVHIPVDELPGEWEKLGEPTGVICVCQTGDRSSDAAAFLASVGVVAYAVNGGITTWPGSPG